MLALKVEKHDAEKARQQLLQQNALSKESKAFRKGNFVFFPITGEVKVSVPHSIVKTKEKFHAVEKTKSLKELLAEIIPENQLAETVSSYELVGSIAILEIPQKSSGKKKQIAKLLLKNNKRVKSIWRKIGKRKGTYRLRSFEWLAGKKSLVTTHRENGCSIKIDLGKVFFNSKMANQRLRIAKLVKNREKVLVLFAGVGPFAVVIAKQNKKAAVKAVELNPHAIKLMKENVALNKLEGRIGPIHADVLKFMKKHGKWADRILMPLAFGGNAFLPSVVQDAAKGATIHYFAIGNERDGIYAQALDDVARTCTKAKRRFKTLNKTIGWPYAPRQSVVVIDFKLMN